ncbi:MAG: TIGR04283 family arsenosugar biosynthesis glycosyltransferase [Solirubrobacteraceae bacterium]
MGSVERLRHDFPDCELVVVDGSSGDGTAERASAHCRVLDSPPGRARQMNLGAEATRSEVLWFIHADVEVDPSALGQLRAVLADEEVVGGGLSLRFDRRSLGLDYLAWSSTRRARYLHQVFGDQALFVRRDVFDELGGFPDLPIMEDLELSRRLARVGHLAVLDTAATASARRLVEHGTWSLIVYMQYLRLLYFAGIDPAAIARRYRAGPPWSRHRRASKARLLTTTGSRRAGLATEPVPGAPTPIPPATGGRPE